MSQLQRTKAAGSRLSSDAPVDSAPLDSFESLNHEDIARLAFALWEDRGCPQGSPNDDWFQAERELRSNPISEHLSADHKPREEPKTMRAGS
jgi:hypothetical protein